MKNTELAQIALSQDHTGAVANPIYLSTAYQHPHLGESTGYDYTRTKNPTRSAFEEAFAKLERGTASFATSEVDSVVESASEVVSIVEMDVSVLDVSVGCVSGFLQAKRPNERNKTVEISVCLDFLI